MLAVLWPRVDLRTAVALFTVTGGLIGMGDTLVHGILFMYLYTPHLLPGPEADGPLGMLLGDYLFVPVAASALAALAPPWRWPGAAVLVVLMESVERSFVKAGFFVLLKWPEVATLAVFAIYFAGAVVWLRRFERTGYRGANRYFVLLTGATYIVMVVGAVSSLLLGIWDVQPRLLGASFPDKVLGNNLLMGLPTVALAVAAAWRGWFDQATFYLLTAAGLTVWTLALDWLGMWRSAVFWSPLLQGLSLTLAVWAAGRLDRWFLAETHPNRARARS